jgi:hypothetical protein
MKKQTAVEWYHTKLAEPTTQAKDVNTIFLLAKAMEKEQIIESYNEGAIDGLELGEKYFEGLQLGEEYYNETYGGNI